MIILKPYEMADYLRISYQTLIRHIKKDKDFPVIRVNKATQRFDRDKVLAYFEKYEEVA